MSDADLTVSRALRTLQKAGYHITSPRRAVVEAVVGRDRRFTWADIVADLAESSRPASRATVFRTLELLEELQLIGRVLLADGGRSYVVCPEGYHHHAICSRCHAVVDLPGCPLGSEMEREARSAGFRLQGHWLEYYGICQECQKKIGGCTDVRE